MWFARSAWSCGAGVSQTGTRSRRKLPADRDTLLEFLQHEGAPDDVIDAIAGLSARRKFATIGEIVRALGIPYEED